jgi:hypothetical protein
MNEDRQLSDQLRKRADSGVAGSGHPISFDDVKRSARKMKWQQRAAAGGVAVAVLAIAVPAGIAVTRNSDDDNSNRNVATSTDTPTNPTTPTSPTESPTETATGSTVKKVTLTLDAPAGQAPRVSWLQGKTLHTAQGDTFALPKAYDDVVSYHGGFLGSDVGMATYDEISDGKVTHTYPGGAFAVSTDGTETAWFRDTDDQQASGAQIMTGIASGMGEGQATQDVPGGHIVTKMLFTPSTRVAYQLDDRSTGKRTVWYTDFDGRATQIPGAVGLGGYNSVTDQLAVETSINDSGSCWALYSYGGGESAGGFGRRTCDYSLGQFSSDGRYVIGWPAYLDGWGPGVVSVLDAKTLKPVVSFDKGQDYGVLNAVWDADTDSLVADVYLDGTWQLVRLGVDGSIETAGDPVTADDTAYPFRLVDVR